MKVKRCKSCGKPLNELYCSNCYKEILRNKTKNKTKTRTIADAIDCNEMMGYVQYEDGY